MNLKTQTSLSKTALASQIVAEITEGDLMKDGEKTGSVSGNLEITVNGGVLTKGQADLTLSSSSQKLKLKADVTPKDGAFDVVADLSRSFENPQDAAGKFVGDLNLKASDVKVKGTFKKFDGELPLQIAATSLTNGKMAVRDLKTDADLYFSCADANCTVKLKKPMKAGFSSLQANAYFRQIKLFTPLELTINPDANDPFMTSAGGELRFNGRHNGVNYKAVKNLTLGRGKVRHLFGRNLADSFRRELIIAPFVVVVNSHDNRGFSAQLTLRSYRLSCVPAAPCRGLFIKQILTVGHINNRQLFAVLMRRNIHAHAPVVLIGVGQINLKNFFLDHFPTLLILNNTLRLRLFQ